MSEEKLPISEALRPIEAHTLYKTDKWWAAVVLLESFGRKQVALYLWTKSGEKWKRKHKFVIRDKEEWVKIKDTIEGLVEKLGA